MKPLNFDKKIKDFNNSLKSVEIFLSNYNKIIKISSIIKKIRKL